MFPFVAPLLAQTDLPTTVAGLLSLIVVTLAGVIRLLWVEVKAGRKELDEERTRHEKALVDLLERTLPVASTAAVALSDAGKAMEVMASVTLTPAEAAEVRRALNRAARK